MEQIENDLISNFYTGFEFLAFAILIFIVLIILGIIFKDKILRDYKNSATYGKFVYWLFICALLICYIFLGYKFTLRCMDLKAVNERNFETITGTVIKYSYIAEGNSPKDSILGNPIFEIAGTTEQIELKVGPTELNKTYTIIYLKYCKEARIVSIED